MSERTVTMLAWIVVALYCALLGKAIAKADGFLLDDRGRPVVADHMALWSAGKLTLEGRPEVAYDRAGQRAAQDAHLGRETGNFPWAYPPPFLGLVAVLATMPYMVSFLAFSLLTLALHAMVNGAIVGRPAAAVWLLTPIATYYCVWVGQNGFLNAALLGAGLLLIPARPLLAGVMFGLLTYKPHLGLLIPLALAAAGLWRTFLAAAATAIAVALASLALLGPEPWHAFLAALRAFGADVLVSEYQRPYRLQSLFGLLRSFAIDPAVALAAQTGLAVLLAAAIGLLWRGPASYDLKAAGLAAAALMMTPYVFVYDFPVLTVAMAFLVRHMLATGPVTITRLAPLLAANVLIGLFAALKLSTAFLGAAVILATVFAQAGILSAITLALTRLLGPLQARPRAG